jgi:hypothetical protein
MTKHPHFSRPAIAAIVAVLALSTAPAMAQPAADDPVVEPSLPPVAAEPAPAPEAVAPAPVQIAPPAEVVQSVPASQPEAAAPTGPATRARTATAQPAAPVAATPAAPSPAREILARPVATPAAIPAAEPGVDLAAAQTTPVTQPAATNSDVANASWWALGAGGLLFVGGLGAVALSRSRRRPDSARARRTKDRAPAASKNAVVVEPAMAAEAAIAVPETTGLNSTAKAHSRVKTVKSDWPELEELVAEAPSAENPFVTRSKRMRRAKFLLEHGEPQPLSQPVKHAAKDEPHAAPKTAPKSSPTYSFGGKATARPNWKPATT